MLFSKLKKPSTFFKYLLSYVLIFTVLMLAFFLILRSQLTQTYRDQQTVRIQTHMSAVSAQLREEFLFLTQVDNQILSNPYIRNTSTYLPEQYPQVAYRELLKVDGTSSLIKNIVIHSKLGGWSFSLHNYLTSYEDYVFSMETGANVMLGNVMLRLDIAPYLDSAQNCLIWYNGDAVSTLLYIPKLSRMDRLLFFYELDTNMLGSQIRSILSDEVPAVALLDGSGNVITGEGLNGYADDPALTDPEAGVRTLENGDALFLSGPIHSGFHLAAVVSKDYLPQQVNRAFFSAFASMLALSALGIILVYVAMLFTFRPLQRLVMSLGHEPSGNRRYLEVLSDNYCELNSQKTKLEQTLAQYRESLAQYRLRESASREYPQEELNRFARLLEDNAFAEAGTILEGTLNRFGQDTGRPDYFLGCILLDTLTLITNSMSKAHIAFESYSETFGQAVCLCRNISATENFDTLNRLIHELLFFYEKETMSQLIHTTPLRQMVEENFCDPDFSISVIAQAWHVSDSRMSTLFKEEMGIGFSDCIWQYRLEKAKELLSTTDLPVDEVSLRIGYLSPNSFRRKFKQETGFTPSQYRSQEETQ